MRVCTAQAVAVLADSLLPPAGFIAWFERAWLQACLFFATMCKLAKNVLRLDSVRDKFRPIFHQFEQDIFPLPADSGYALQIDHHLLIVRAYAGPFPRTAQLGCPGRNQRARKYQRSLGRKIKNGYFQHHYSFQHTDNSNLCAKGKQALSC